jgi:hypothetical protein
MPPLEFGALNQRSRAYLVLNVVGSTILTVLASPPPNALDPVGEPR